MIKHRLPISAWTISLVAPVFLQRALCLYSIQSLHKSPFHTHKPALYLSRLSSLGLPWRPTLAARSASAIRSPHRSSPTSGLSMPLKKKGLNLWNAILPLTLKGSKSISLPLPVQSHPSPVPTHEALLMSSSTWRDLASHVTAVPCPFSGKHFSPIRWVVLLQLRMPYPTVSALSSFLLSFLLFLSAASIPAKAPMTTLASISTPSSLWIPVPEPLNWIFPLAPVSGIPTQSFP